jgi:hypothetical protein
MIELIFGYAFGAVAKKVSERWIDQFAEQIDEGAQGLVRNWLHALRDDDAEQAASAAAQLDERARENPALFEQLAAAPPPTAPPTARDVATDQPDDGRRRSRIEQFEEFLAYEFALVEGLRRPVALPGFFNCTDCVTVIDARPEDTSGSGSVHVPGLDRGAFPIVPIEDQTLWLSFEFENPANVPRAWLIATASAARRDELIEALNRRFTEDPPPSLEIFYLDSHELRALLTEDERVQRVKGISRDRVSVVEEDAEGIDSNFYAIRRPTGVELMRTALAALVAEQARAEENWDVWSKGGRAAP